MGQKRRLKCAKECLGAQLLGTWSPGSTLGIQAPPIEICILTKSQGMSTVYTPECEKHSLRKPWDSVPWCC